MMFGWFLDTLPWSAVGGVEVAGDGGGGEKLCKEAYCETGRGRKLGHMYDGDKR